MRLSSSLLVSVVCLTTAAALYASRGVLDRVMTADGSVRLALLPPWQTFVGFVLLAILGLIWLNNRRASAATAVQTRPRLVTIALPLFALCTLVVPYLPWLPDRLPALQMLAGPAKYVIWLLVLTQIAWVLWQAVPRPAPVLERFSVRMLAVVVGAAALLVTGAATLKLANTGLFPGGDEPHYLIIAQSLWRDHDLKIENNHTRGDYYEYFKQALTPHYLTRGVDGQIYSIHPVGLPLLIAPIYGLGGYRLVVVFMLVMAAAAAALMWLWVMRHTNHLGAATFALAAIVVSPPFALNSFTIYPEISAALAVVGALILMPRTDDERYPLGRWLIAGLLAGALPWLSTKYSPMSAAVVVVALSRIWITASTRQILDGAAAKVLRSLALVTPYVVMLGAWFTFFYVIWGTPRPQAPYGALVQTRPFNLVFGAPGLLFDQEYGLMMYAPVYALAATGLVAMWRTGGELRRRAIEILIVWAGLLGTVGAFRIWWGGSASPARPLVSGLLLFALPMAVAFRAAEPGTARRAAQHVLLWVGAAVSVLLVVANNGYLINNDRDGTASLIEYLSPLWEAWTLAPTFVYHEAWTAAGHVIAWLLIATLAAWVLRRARATTPGAASLIALTTFFGALVLGELVLPLLPADPPWPKVELGSRARLVGLDQFDRIALPNAVVYDPLHFMHAENAESRLIVKVDAGARRDRPPTRVMHNGRFSLPAGRYRLDMQWAKENPTPAAETETLGLQVGRFGPPMRNWSVSPAPGGHWQTEIELPLDAGFVGLVGTRELEAATASIAFTPLTLVDRARRTQTEQVLAASQFGTTMVLFHDNSVYQERDGFWTVGAALSHVAVAESAEKDGDTVLLVRPGPEPNRVQISSAGWQQTLDLRPGLEEAVTLPRSTRRVVELQIVTERSFVPAQIDKASKDHRKLGAWVEVQSSDASVADATRRGRSSGPK